jgi:flagellar protein FlaG
MIGKIQDVSVSTNTIVLDTSRKTTADTAGASASKSENTSGSMIEAGAVQTTTENIQSSEQLAAASQQIEKKEDTAGKKLSENDVSSITQALNDLMSQMNCDLEFKYYEKLDRLSIKMVNPKTQKIIKEFPPEDMLKTMIKTKEWLGVFLDKKA